MRKILYITILLLFFLGCENSISKSFETQDSLNKTNEFDKLSNDNQNEFETWIDNENKVVEQDSINDNNDFIVDNQNDYETQDEDNEPKQLKYFANFLEIPKINYTLDNKKYVSGIARIFYQFQPADKKS